MIVQMPPWGALADWQAANRSIEYHLKQYVGKLEPAVIKAGEMQQKLGRIFPVQDQLCLQTCSHCPDPCCLNASVWLEFKDLLFIHLSGQTIPPHQLYKKPGETCRYAGYKGCRLPRLSRPWTCTLYLCPPQKTLLRCFSDNEIKDYEETVQDIKTIRNQLEMIYIDTVSDNRN